MHEARPGIGGHQGDDAIADLGVVLRREGPHHDAHGPDHLHADMGSSDALSGSSAPEIGIFRAPHEPARVFVNRVRALHVAQTRAGGEAFFVCPFQDRVNDKKVNEENSIIIEG